MTAQTPTWRRHLTYAWLALVLVAFAYGSSGCASNPAPRALAPCPDVVSSRMEYLVQMRACEGSHCELLMTSCFISKYDVIRGVVEDLSEQMSASNPPH